MCRPQATTTEDKSPLPPESTDGEFVSPPLLEEIAQGCCLTVLHRAGAEAALRNQPFSRLK